MTQPHRRSARLTRAVGRAPKIPANVAVKAATGAGLVVGATALLAAPSATSAAPKEPTAQASASAQADAMLDARGSSAAQRSTARTAISAPSQLPAPMRESTADAGALKITAVAKPKPKPKPKPVETPSSPGAATTPSGASSSTASSDASSSTASSGASGGTAGGSQPSTQAPAASTSVNTSSFSGQARAIGLGPNASAVYSAVRTQFPSMTNIGGYRAGDPGDHGSGRAVDIMVTGSPGDAVVAYLQANAGRLNISYLIWQQRYWAPGSGWKMMADRGSPTQNHYDHVHVSVH